MRAHTAIAVVTLGLVACGGGRGGGPAIPLDGATGTDAEGVDGGSADAGHGGDGGMPPLSGCLASAGTPEVVSELGGLYYDAAFSGDLVVLTMGDELRIFDVSDPASPQQVGTLTYGDPWFDQVAVSGHFAFMTGNEFGLHVIDLSNPAIPRVAGELVLPQPARHLVLYDTWLYVASSADALYVIDASNPEMPVTVGPASVHMLDAVGALGLGYVGTYRDLALVSLAAPSSPMAAGRIDVGPADQVSNGDQILAGPYVFIAEAVSSVPRTAADVGRLEIWDARSPLTPVRAGSFDIPNTPGQSVGVSGVRAVFGFWNGFHILDVTNYAAPSIVTTFMSRTYKDARWVRTQGRYAYVQSGGDATYSPTLHVVRLCD